MVIPTFDDAPDGPIDPNDPMQHDDFVTYGMGSYTKQLIQFFDTNNLHMDFFINTNNWCGDLLQTPECVTTLASLLKTQNPANHTVHHTHMGGNMPFDPSDLSSSSCGTAANSMISCDDEMKGVETVVNMVSNGGRPHLTRFRAPYGEPFQTSSGALAAIRDVTKKYAVHVGWQVDSTDSICNNGVPPCLTGAQVADKIKQFIGNAPGQGQGWGVVLMHGDFPWTFEAVKMLFDPNTGYIKTHGFKLATVEDAICWKYGKHSWEIVQQLAGQPRAAN
jgi:peptidoglycan/xylan/chitin deacetylase (PgdA/CDA1 family)